MKIVSKRAKFHYLNKMIPIVEFIRKSGAFLTEGGEVRTDKISPSILGFFDYVNPSLNKFAAFAHLKENTGEIQDILKAFLFLKRNSSATIEEFIKFGNNLGLKRLNLRRWYRGGKIRKTKHPGVYLNFKSWKDELVLDFMVFYALQMTDHSPSFPNSPSDNPLEAMLITGCREIISKVCATNVYLHKNTELELRDLDGRDLTVERHVVPNPLAEMVFLAFNFKYAMRHGVSQSDIIDFAKKKILSLHDLFRCVRYKNPLLDKSIINNRNFVCYALQVVFGRAKVRENSVDEGFSGSFRGSDAKIHVFEISLDRVIAGFSLRSEDFLSSKDMFNLSEWSRSSAISKYDNHLVELTKSTFVDLKKHINNPDNITKRKRAINYIIHAKVEHDIEIDHLIFLDEVVFELMKSYYTVDSGKLILHDCVIENFERYSYLFSSETVNKKLSCMIFRFV